MDSTSRIELYARASKEELKQDATCPKGYDGRSIEFWTG